MNSAEVAWGDFQVLFDGNVLAKLRGLQYKWNQENEHIHAAGNKPIGINPGNVSPDGSLKILKGDHDKLNRAAQALGYQNISNVPVTIVATYKKTFTTPRQTDTLVGVHISEYEKGMEQGAKMSEMTLSFKFLDLIEQYGN